MTLKTYIKNDLWRINYIIPFTAKYLQYGKVGFLKRSLPVIAKLRVVKGEGPRDISTDIVALMKKVDLDIIEGSSYFYWIDERKTIAVRGVVLSNFCIDYDRVVNGAFNYVADKAIAVGGTYGMRAVAIKEAIGIMRDRAVETITAKCADETTKAQMLADMQNLLEKPAEHLHEGLQRVLFFNQYMWQTRHGLNGLGRLDKILGNLYQNDIEAGLITRESAYDMVYDFLNCLNHWYEYKSSSILGDIGQVIILGGLEPDGTYFCNELTTIFLEAQSALKKPDPKTFLRVSEKMPHELMVTAVKALMTKQGSPLFSNDDVVIPMLKQFGWPDADCYTYCVSACWEPFIPGKSLDQNNIRAFDFYRPLDKALNEGNLNACKDIEDVVKLYEASLRKEWQKFLNELNAYIWACDPFVSMLTDGCNESGKDISEGGAVNSNYGVTSIGMSSAIDTIFNIKKLVFDEKKLSLAELNEKRKANYKGEDDLLNMLKGMKHSYAHDNDEAIALVNRVIAVSNEEVDKYTNPLGGKVKFGLSSPFYVRDAKGAPADVAGRCVGDPYSTHISCPDVAYTELVNFAGKLDYSGYAFNGNVLDFFVSPGFLESNMDKFVMFMKAAIKVGYFQMQMNIMDSATLIDAKAHPEKYPGLIVRVWGFSAYFNDLPEAYKDVLIERALQSEKLL